MVKYVILFELEEDLTEKINKLKRLAYLLVGDQQYLSDLPHLTLYVGDFQQFTEWKDGFSRILKTIENDNFQLEIEQWLEFKNDVVTGKHTLACKINDMGVFRLRKIQDTIVNFLNNYRNKNIITRYESNFSRFNEIEKKNIEIYGFPFIGDIWIPHVTIASFNETDYNIILEKIRNNCPKGRFKIKSVDIHELDNEEKLHLIKQFPME